MTSGRVIRVAVIDDHPAIALAIEAAITTASTSETPGGPDDDPLVFSGSARSLDEARVLLARPESAADVVLCDVQLQRGLDGLDAIGIAREAGARAIVFTSFERASLMRAAFERGASGFLDKGAEPAAIVAAIREVGRGGTAFSATALDAARFGPRAPSPREVAVVDGLRRGETSDEIGRRLGISSRTVESHLRRMFDRYGVVSRTELALFAIDQGWLAESG
ncbi:MAG TPA: response regulator transcription factor [Candidatus Limnocylindria bacterium]|nr:response regulator transcription factor [Candidatus Limnocylindria bacterium]